MQISGFFFPVTEIRRCNDASSNIILYVNQNSGHYPHKAAFPLTRLNGRAGERACSAARQKPFHWRVETRRNAQERAGDVVTLFQTVSGTCRPVHEVPFSRNAVITGHSTINVGQHLHADIGLSNASDIH